MCDRRERGAPGRRLAAGLAAGLLGVMGAAGCGGPGGGQAGGTATGVAVSKGNGSFSAAELKGALLTRINGVGPLSRPDAGSYAALPEVQAAAAQMNGVTVTPRSCEQATVPQGAVLDTGALGSAPAAVVNFRVGTNGVSEVLAAPASAASAAAVGGPIPAGCANYSASTGRQTYRYAVRQDWVQGIGTRPARVLNIAAIGQRPPTEVWSVLYKGDGFVGAITVVGPNASQTAIRQLGQQAYAFAARTLS
jgi:hypothetical protein